MRPVRRRLILSCLVVAVSGLLARTFAQSAPAAVEIQVAADHPGAAIPSTLFGIFFEDINFAADGGLYPER